MKTRDYTQLLAELAKDYTQHSPKSAALHDRAKKHLVDGGSHALRLTEPFPPRLVSAQGAWFKDEDGHNILDFWQGHFGNILGHNPEVVTLELVTALENGVGLQTGFPDRLQIECAEILCQQSGADRARFTTSGSLATMYSIMLSRSFTGRKLVMKVGGGWHGAQPWGLKGVGFDAGGVGYQRVESEGLPPVVTDAVVVTSFNDSDMLRDHFRQYGDRLACFILEPLIGAGGVIPATLEYVQTARELTEQYGAVFILDEVIAGFRFRAGNAGMLFGIQPDLTTYGKIIGGGMPVSAVAGRADIMDLVGNSSGQRVKFSGGTYSAHPASLLAAKMLMAYLVAHEKEVYPRLAELGEKTRQTIEAAFAEEGVLARCTGYGNDALMGNPMFMFHFPYRDDVQLDKPEKLFDPTVCDVALNKDVSMLALLLEDVYAIHSHGTVTAAHTEADIELLGDACRKAARRFKPYL